MGSFVITDMATLKSSLRALGKLPLIEDSRHLFDIDIANLAKLIEDLILFDIVYYPEHPIGLDRIKPLLGALGDAIKPLRVPPELESLINEQVPKRLSRSTTVAELFDVIGLIPKSFWTDLLDSTLKYLVFQGLGVRHKYSDIMMKLYFHKGLSEADLAKIEKSQLGIKYFNFKRSFKNIRSRELLDWDNFEVDLQEAGLPEVDFAVDSGGQILTGDSHRSSQYSPGFAISTEMADLTKKLLWSHFRTHYYIFLAESFGMSYSPHTLRSPLAHYAILSTQTPLPQLSTDISEAVQSRIIRKRLLDFIENEAGELSNTIHEFYGVKSIQLKLPSVFFHVVSKAKDLDELIEIAYNLRDTRPVKDYRRKCDAIYEGLRNGEPRILLDVMQDVKSLCINLKKEFGIVESESANLKLSIGPIEITKEIKLPKTVHKQYFLGSTYLVFLRNVYFDLVKISRMGNLYDKLFAHAAKGRQ